MNYDFPEIRTIDDVLPAIKDRKEFIVAEKEGYTVINYMVQTPETFGVPEESGKMTKDLYGTLFFPDQNDLIRRECRGIIFDTRGDNISRPFHKFFNYGERLETQAHKLDMKRDHIRLLKLDGSMIRPIFFREHNGFRLGTKMGITDVAMKAEVHVAENLKYFTFFRKMLENGYTPIFEWMSPDNRIVIDYKERNLVLTAIRDTVYGNYLSYDEMHLYADPLDIPVVEFEDGTSDFGTFLTESKKREDIEGFVLRFDNGHMIKIKAEPYLRMHKSKDIVSSDRRIIELILEENIDDIKPMLIPEDIVRVEELERKVAHNVELLSNKLSGQMMRFGGMEKKEFAIQHSNELQPFYRKAVFQLLDNRGKTEYEIAKSFLLDQSRADGKFDQAKKEYALEF